MDSLRHEFFVKGVAFFECAKKIFSMALKGLDSPGFDFMTIRAASETGLQGQEDREHPRKISKERRVG